MYTLAASHTEPIDTYNKTIVQVDIKKIQILVIKTLSTPKENPDYSYKVHKNERYAIYTSITDFACTIGETHISDRLGYQITRSF
jgi:hypothetical protein